MPCAKALGVLPQSLGPSAGLNNAFETLFEILKDSHLGFLWQYSFSLEPCACNLL